MNKIYTHISELLRLNDQVIIPKFGAFVCTYKPAEITEDSSYILPPSKEVAFNKNLSYNNGLLVDYVAEKENVSTQKAEQLISLLRDEINGQLSRGEKVVCGDIGTLEKDSHDIKFTASKTNFLIDSLGLESLSLNVMSVEHKTKSSAKLRHYKRHRFAKFCFAVASIFIGVAIVLSLLYLNDKKYFDSYVSNNSNFISPDLVGVDSLAYPFYPQNDKPVATSIISPSCDYLPINLKQDTLQHK